MKNSNVHAALLFLFGACFLPGCGPDRPPEPTGPETVLLVTVDSFRADILEPYGGKTEISSLRTFLEQGVVYDDLTAVSPMTRPSLGTILTGLPPAETGLLDDVSDRLPRDLPTLGSVFEDAGWDTAAFVDSPIVSWSSGFQRGFGLFDGPEELAFGPGAYAPVLRPFSESTEHFHAWLKAGDPKENRFAWVHFSGLTEAVTGSPKVKTAEAYKTALDDLNESLASLIKVVRSQEAKRTVRIYLVGTFGALLGEESFGTARGSSYWLQPETLQVPVFSYDSNSTGKAGIRVQEPLCLLDLFPVLQNIARHEINHPDDSRIRSFRDSDRLVRYAWSWAPGDEQNWPVLTAVKLGKQWRAFDSDILQTAKPDGRDPSLTAALKNPAMPRAGRLNEDLRRKMRDAGIVLGEDTRPGPPLEGKGKITFLKNLFLLRHHFGHDHQRPAAKLSRRMLEVHPDNLSALMNRGCLMVMAGEVEKAEPIFSRLLKLYPDYPAVLHLAAHVELLKQENERASLLLVAARSLGFEDPDLLYDTACLLALEGKSGEAIEALEHAVAAGYRNWVWIERDGDLASIRSDPGYFRILKERGR